jgi:hypothetical protein
MRVKTYVIKKTERNDTFETRSEFFGEGLKAQGDESGGRILLGDNTCCCRSGSNVMQFRFQLESLVYIYVFDHMYNQLRFAQNSTCTGPSGAHLMRKSASFCVLSSGVTLTDGFGVHNVAGGWEQAYSVSEEQTYSARF